MSRRQLFTVTFLLVFILLLWQLGLILSPFFSPILWAVILATTTYPVYIWLLACVGQRGNVAAGIMTGGVLIIAVVPAVYGMILAGQQGVEAYAQASEWLKGGHLKDIGVVLAKVPGVGGLIQELGGRLTVSGSGQVEDSLLEGGKAVSAFLLSQGVDFARNALLLATDFLIMLFTLFFLFRDGAHTWDTILRAIPLEEEHKAKIFERLNTTMKAVVRGTLLSAVAQGATTGVTYYLLGVPFSVFLGALSGLLTLLPVGGSAIVWAPVALYLLFSGAVAKGVILIGVGGRPGGPPAPSRRRGSTTPDASPFLSLVGGPRLLRISRSISRSRSPRRRPRHVCDLPGRIPATRQRHNHWRHERSSRTCAHGS